MAASSTNQGGWYTFICNGIQFTLPVRYQNPVRVGEGAFGAVIRVTDTETDKNVAIKRMLHPFQTPSHAKRTYRELKLLIVLNHPDAQVVKLYDVFTPDKDFNDFETLYFVFNFVDYDLNRVINRHLHFDEDHIKQIIYSLLCGLKYIHSARVLHRDLKPTNIGIDTNSNITILDFGLARLTTVNELTGYVATRWWRAPEVYINWERYDDKLDIWSAGCIMGELILLHPLFRGADQLDQLNKIFDIIGTPDLATINSLECTPEVHAYLTELSPKPRQDFSELFGYKYDPVTQVITSGVSPEGVDLLSHLLSFDPLIRPTAEQAILLLKYIS